MRLLFIILVSFFCINYAMNPLKEKKFLEHSQDYPIDHDKKKESLVLAKNNEIQNQHTTYDESSDKVVADENASADVESGAEIPPTPAAVNKKKQWLKAGKYCLMATGICASGACFVYGLVNIFPNDPR